MGQRVSPPPLMHFVVLIDVPCLRPRNPIEGCDRCTPEPRQCAKHSALLFSNFRPLQLVNHFIALLNRRFRELLRRVLAAERLQLTIWHFRVNVEAAGARCCTPARQSPRGRLQGRGQRRRKGSRLRIGADICQRAKLHLRLPWPRFDPVAQCAILQRRLGRRWEFDGQAAKPLQTADGSAQMLDLNLKLVVVRPWRNVPGFHLGTLQ
mmetsp:Transcript_27839/g.76974  ORF Transcript_27839/g.76974 Transcript_27839/m.76974 type:complete len:208 (+) Transcript_27839:136-759(+)